MQQERDTQGRYEDTERDEMDQEVEETKSEDAGATKRASGSGRGFASMSQEQRRAIASKGGKAQGKHNNSGNFANNRDKAVAAGRAGGQNSHGGGRRSQGGDLVDDDTAE